MKTTLKWLAIIIGGLVVLVIAALIILPLVVDVQYLKPLVEKQVAKATGRSFTIGDEINLSLFPTTRLSFTDLRLGNLEGFEAEDLLSVEAFDLRVKLMPLITSMGKNIQVKRFVVTGPRVVLEKQKDGTVNWQNIGARAGQEDPAQPESSVQPEEPGSAPAALPVEAFDVEEFAVSDGSLLWIDHAKAERREIADLNLSLENVSLDSPVQLSFHTTVDGKPVSLAGSVGPIGREPGKGLIELDLKLAALEAVQAALKGQVQNAAADAQFDLVVDIAPFSLRKVFQTLERPFPLATADADTLTRIALGARIKGDPGGFQLSDGKLQLDDTTLTFTARAGDFAKPEVGFDLELDRIDLDRYLPGQSEGGTGKSAAGSATPEAATGGPAPAKPDYAPLRRLVLDGAFKAGAIKVRGARLADLVFKIKGRDGLIRVDPLAMNLYDGRLEAKADMNVQGQAPRSAVDVDLSGVQAGPLLRDTVDKDIIEGLADARMKLRTLGDDPATLKKHLNGEAYLNFGEGAIKGIDLVAMVRNLEGAFDLDAIGDKDARTEFTELQAPLTITNGRVNTTATTLRSPALTVAAKGQADLVEEKLDFRIEPKVVVTKTKKEQQKSKTYAVPVIVAGTFDDPKVYPDVKGVARQQLEEKVFESEEFKETFEKEELKPFEDTAKGLLKGLLD